VKLLAYITDAFIAVFGITQPHPEQKRLANVLIGGFLLIFIAGAFGMVGFMVYRIAH
jgi:hypothetical protein